MTIDCPDKTCWLEFRVVPTCVMYVPKDHSNCDIPCNLVNCSVEVRHFFDCPIWTCNGKLTTLPPDPTSSTISPLPPAPSSGSNVALYLSTSANVLFVLCIAFAIWQVRKYRRNRRSYSDPSGSLESGIIRSRDGSSMRHFTLDDPEVEPLLSGTASARIEPPSQSSGSTQASQTHENFLQRLRNFRWSFTSHRWVETEPESNDSTRNNTDLSPSAPTISNENSIANDSVQLN